MAVSNDELARWAASFLALCEEAPPIVAPPAAAAHLPEAAAPPVRSSAITPAAHALLDAIDAGGVPAFMTTALRQIANDNGIEVSAQTTPNHIVDVLRAKCLGGAT